MGLSDLVPKTQESYEWFDSTQTEKATAEDIQHNAWVTIAILDSREDGTSPNKNPLDEQERWLRDALVKQHGRSPRHASVPRFPAESEKGEVTE